MAEHDDEHDDEEDGESWIFRRALRDESPPARGGKCAAARPAPTVNCSGDLTGGKISLLNDFRPIIST